jgi:hypothetical protein
MQLVGAVWKSLKLVEKGKWDMENPDNQVSDIPAIADALVAKAISTVSSESSGTQVLPHATPANNGAAGDTSKGTLNVLQRQPSHLSSGAGLQTHDSMAEHGEHAAQTRPMTTGASASTPTMYTTETDGETVASIASKWGVNLDLLVEMNKQALPGMSLKARLKTGTRLNLPRPGQVRLTEQEGKTAGGNSETSACRGEVVEVMSPIYMSCLLFMSHSQKSRKLP